jgi:small subunit ribosomal protein S16
MAVRIRLARMGSKKRPFYRIVAADARCPRDGRFLEKLGTYDPARKELELNRSRLEYWQSVGAQPTNTVSRLIRIQPPAPKPA